MKLTLHFDYPENAPRLMGIWLEGYGWIKGGAYTGDLSFTIEFDADSVDLHTGGSLLDSLFDVVHSRKFGDKLLPEK